MQTHFVCRLHDANVWILVSWRGAALTIQVLTCSPLPARVGTASSLRQGFVKFMQEWLKQGLVICILDSAN